MTDKKFEFKRGLKTKDIFKASKILRKIELDFSKIKVEGLSQEQAGMNLIKTVFENLDKAENEVNEFLGDLVGLTAEEFSNLNLEDSMEIIKEFKNLKGLDIFFKQVVKQTDEK